MPRQRRQQLPGTRHRERQHQPISLRQGQSALGRLIRRALVTQLTAGQARHGYDLARETGLKSGTLWLA
jgi:hypothetical protein